MRRCKYGPMDEIPCQKRTFNTLPGNGFGECSNSGYIIDDIEGEPIDGYYICTLPDEAWINLLKNGIVAK